MDLLAGVDGKELEAGVGVAFQQAIAAVLGGDVGGTREPKGGVALRETDRAVVDGLMEKEESGLRDGIEQIGFQMNKLIAVAVDPGRTFEEQREFGVAYEEGTHSGRTIQTLLEMD